MTKLIALTAVIGFAVDQISKLYVVFWLDLINLQEIDVFAPFLNFRMAFSIPNHCESRSPIDINGPSKYQFLLSQRDPIAG